MIDLSLPIYQGMSVYPGDPEIKIKQIQTLEKDGWNMIRIHMNSHDGTHVNVPIHATLNGKTLDEYEVEDFCGECLLDVIETGKGVIFTKPLTMETAKIIVEKKPKFIGTSQIEDDVEKFLLENNIIIFENLTNIDKLPKKFFFHGAPLKIRLGDGSPVRAYAKI